MIIHDTNACISKLHPCTRACAQTHTHTCVHIYTHARARARTQILETGFLSVFLSAPFCRRDGSPSSMIVWLFRLQCFRLMLGAGRSKIMAAEPCWKFNKLDCMSYHYETTGSPSPLAWLLYRLPRWVHQAGKLSNFSKAIHYFFFFFRWVHQAGKK